MIIQEQTLIHASNKIIWKYLFQTMNYFKWNSFIKTTSIELKVGEYVWVFVRLPNGFPIIFKAYILEIIPNKRIKWESMLIHKSLLTGTHTFEINKLSKNSCIFVQKETFQGFLKKIDVLLKEQMTQGFINMNNELKEISEKVNP